MLAGIILATLVVVFVAYVLWLLQASNELVNPDEEEPTDVTTTMVMVRSGLFDPEPPEPRPAVTRHMVIVAARRAVRRRRLGLVASVFVCLVVLFTIAFSASVTAVWLWAVIGIMGAWVGLTRLSKVLVDKQLEQIFEQVLLREKQEALELAARQATLDAVKHQASSVVPESSIDLDKPVQGVTQFNDPMPIAPVTYVNQPVMPRSARWIDISSLSADSRFPVTVESPRPAERWRPAEEPYDALPQFFEEGASQAG